MQGRRLFCTLTGLQSNFSATVNHSGNLHIRAFAEANWHVLSAINSNAFRPTSCKVLMVGISSSSSCLSPLYPLHSPSFSQHPDPHGYAIRPFSKGGCPVVADGAAVRSDGAAGAGSLAAVGECLFVSSNLAALQRFRRHLRRHVAGRPRVTPCESSG